MCTAISLTVKDHYFGRNLDLDRTYDEEVCVMPRRFPLAFRAMAALREHSAMIGMATVVNGLPLYYDAANEHGLAMAGLNFPGNACYAPPATGKDNIASFELIPWILGQCQTLQQAKGLLSRLNLTDTAFSPQLPPAPLHWMICGREGSLTVEFTQDGLHLYDNEIGVLTNNPPFAQQVQNWLKYRHLRIDNGSAAREEPSSYVTYSQGLGAVGLPGDVSSMSRFVRAAFGREHSVCDEDETAAVGQFFHLLTSVEMIAGLCKTDEGTWDKTVYSACINLERGLYYYTTYDDRRISCVDMRRADLSGERLSRFALLNSQRITRQN